MPVMSGNVFCTEQNFKEACSKPEEKNPWVPKGLDSSLVQQKATREFSENFAPALPLEKIPKACISNL